MSASAAAEASAATASPAAAAEPIVRAPSRPLAVVRAWEIILVATLAAALYLPRLGAYNLWDPWETHYAEVARRMLQDEEWIHLKWQNESFRSKPVLTFWLMGLGMKTFGVGDGGGYSGEFVSSPLVEFSLRLPFALFGIGGLVILFYALARLYSRRVAWLATGILATSPYYFFVSRQAITDMPSCAMLIGSTALFALAMFDDEKPLKRWRFGLTWFHFFLFALAVVLLPQLVYFNMKLWGTKMKLMPGFSLPWSLVMGLLCAGLAGFLVWAWMKTKTVSQVQMYFVYLFAGLGFLAKGPVAAGLTGLTVLFYLILSGEWKLLKKSEIPRGILIVLLVGLPWHLGMYIRDGMGWVNEYIGMHWFNRIGKGMHGERGSFNYYFSQFGVGMWPWACFIPAALANLVGLGRVRTREERVRLLVGVWMLASTTFFMAIVTTKFHHYILPALPPLAVLVAFYFDDMLEGRIKWPAIGLLVSLAIFAIVCFDFVSGQLKLVNLFIYRYDRPWPSGPPWSIDFTTQLTVFACIAGAVMLALLWGRTRVFATAGLVVTALAFSVFAIQVLMVAASPHWGQKKLHEVYYKNRGIHGVDLEYLGLRELRQDWDAGRDFEVRSVIPTTLHVGDAQKVSISAGGEKVELTGAVSKIDAGDARFYIHLPEAERQKLEPLLARARTAKDPRRRRFVSVDADRMIAWQLNWRGENFWSGGEIYQHRFEDARTVYMETDNKAFLEYLKNPARMGHNRKFWVVTEKGRLNGLPNVLPTPYAKQTFQVEDNSSNKFGLGSFTLDEGPGSVAVPPETPEPTPAPAPAPAPGPAVSPTP